MPKKPLTGPVKWLSEKAINENCAKDVSFYDKFQFKNIIASTGDFILVSNADAAEPDTEEGCDAARIISLYENREKKSDPYRAKVQWYTRPADLPSSCLNNVNLDSEKEVIEDRRPFDTDVSIETFFKKCNITTTFTHTDPAEIISDSKPFQYICRYRITAISKRKFNLEPVLEQERKAMELLSTPTKAFTPIVQSPNSLVKRMNRVSISESKNWSVSKKDDTKLLLKRAILADKIEKDSPRKTPRNTPKKVETPTSVSRISRSETKMNVETPKSIINMKGRAEDMISMELEEGSDDELPTLIIRQHVPTTPKRKSVASKTTTPIKKTLDFDDDFLQTTTRSGRKVKNADYLEQELSPIKRTTTRSTRKRDSNGSDDEEFKAEVATPRSRRTSVSRTPRASAVTPKITRTPKASAVTPKTSRTPRTSVGNLTPRSVKRKIMTSELTPTLKSRVHSVENVSEFAKGNKSLPGRENQLEEILSFVRTNLLESSSGCMYISGVPGTGKTATVCAALQSLQAEAGLPNFQRVDINGMRLAEPRQAYVQIYKQLTGKTVAWEQACSLLEKRFTNPGPRRTPTVLLVDELDALCTRRQDVVYGIVEWCCSRDARLTVLAVANTMDLPERALHNRVASRLGLTRLTFPPYTHTQLQAIVATRLADANVTPDAVQLIARKVASVSGDARRALTLCARALELGGGGAGLSEVQRALAEASSGAGVRAIRACAPAERLLLRAVASEVERTGSDETTLSRALLAAAALVALEGRPYRSAPALRPPTPSQALSICARLSSLKLLLLEPKAEPRLLLNVSTDDVHYATRQISV